MNIQEICDEYQGATHFIGPEYPGDFQSLSRFVIIQEICNRPGDLQLSSRFSLPRPWIRRFVNIHVIWASLALNVPEISKYTGDLCFIGPKYPGDSRFMGPGLIGNPQKVWIWPPIGTKDFRTGFYKGTDRTRPTNLTFCWCPRPWIVDIQKICKYPG